MSLDEIQGALLGVLREVQSLRGRLWTPLGPTAKPIGDMDGFDSLTGVEVTVMLEEKLGCREIKVDSLFVSEDGKQALTVKEIAQRITKLLPANGGRK